TDPRNGNRNLHVAATMYRPGLTGILIKKIAGEPVDKSYRKKTVQKGWVAFGCSSAQAYIRGTMVFSFEGRNVQVAFDNAFLFTCMKSKEAHKLQWSMSLS